MLEHEKDIVIRVVGDADDAVLQMTVREFLDSLDDEDSRFGIHEIELLADAFSWSAPNAEVYQNAASDMVIKFRLHD